MTSIVSSAPIEDLTASPRRPTSSSSNYLPSSSGSPLGFESLPEAVEGVAEARMVIGTGGLVRAFAVYGLLMSDDSVELIGIEIDTAS